MKRLLTVIFALTLSAFAARGQKVCEWSNGLAYQPSFYRGNPGIGWVAKRYFNDRHALDLGVFYYTNKTGSELNGAFEWTLPVPFFQGLSLYGGPGVHLGFHSEFGGIYGRKHLTYGVMGIAGLEYKIPPIPMMVGLDWRPRYTFATGSGVDSLDLGCLCLSVKFCIF